MSTHLVKLKKLKALHDYILVTDMNFDTVTRSSGIIIQSLDKKIEGVHPRWGKVYEVGPDQKDVRPGQYVLVKHGRWTRGVDIQDDQGQRVLRRIDNDDILVVSDTPHEDEIINSGI